MNVTYFLGCLGLVVHALAHLYRATQKLVPDFFWDDLEFLIYHQRHDVFGLQAHRTSSDAMNIYGRSFGVQCRLQKTNVPDPLPSHEISSTTAKELQGNSAYLSMCVQAELKFSQPDHLTLACQEYAASRGTGVAVTTPITMELLEIGLTEGLVHLHFDHHAFFLDCLALMVLIMQDLESSFPAIISDNAMFYEIVDELLWEKEKFMGSADLTWSFSAAAATLIQNVSHAKYLSAAESLAGIPDSTFRDSRPSAVEARAREQQAKAELLKDAQAVTARAREEGSKRQKAEAKKLKAEMAGPRCCPDCGRWFSP